ncbi:MAG: hypothetical protein KGL39_29755 [Patescibacteria group bacterium]|nr:hypothetical protein [Patescibacteria group bacterium]
MYLVRCRNAAGTARELRIPANTAAVAIREALRRLENDYPAQGWRAEFAL